MCIESRNCWPQVRLLQRKQLSKFSSCPTPEPKPPARTRSNTTRPSKMICSTATVNSKRLCAANAFKTRRPGMVENGCEVNKILDATTGAFVRTLSAKRMRPLDCWKRLARYVPKQAFLFLRLNALLQCNNALLPSSCVDSFHFRRRASHVSRRYTQLGMTRPIRRTRVVVATQC